ncbi:DUF4870 domain-containing protein [Pseudonocardia nigra]|uniref:DUF4870 domain-containing protein n=1 Tax=Pseudonocardia nigra TaxID=1921578 RepID=UPI001FE41981|nr:DUF4870 domain-containing protein [Pseudonocardia nigra]
MTSQPGPSWPPRGDPRYAEPVPTDDRNWAMAAHLGSFLTAWFALGLVAPLVVLLLRGGSSAYVRRHAIESLNFQINAFVWSVLFGLLAFLIIGIVLLLPYLAFYAICVVVGAVRASSGRSFRYPLTIRFLS